MQKLPLIMLLSLTAPLVQASHNYGGLDLCALYPETMPPGMPLEQLPEADSAGALVLQNYCAQCHNLPGPGRHSAAEWPEVLARMNTLMAVSNRFGGLLGNVKIPGAEEFQQLLDYMNRHSLQPLNSSPEGNGAKAFVQHCSACHVLPDPLQHSPGEWSQVIKRMQRNMQIMRYDPPSADSLMQIQLYLQSGPTASVTANEPLNRPAADEHGSRFKGIMLALGPFLLLIIIGLLRWNSRRSRSCHSGAK